MLPEFCTDGYPIFMLEDYRGDYIKRLIPLATIEMAKWRAYWCSLHPKSQKSLWEDGALDKRYAFENSIRNFFSRDPENFTFASSVDPRSFPRFAEFGTFQM